MFNLIKKLFSPTKKWDLDDPNYFTVIEKVLTLEKEIKYLKQENIELTNSLYECENRIQSQIDNIHPVIYNIESKD